MSIIMANLYLVYQLLVSNCAYLKVIFEHWSTFIGKTSEKLRIVSIFNRFAATIYRPSIQLDNFLFIVILKLKNKIVVEKVYSHNA